MNGLQKELCSRVNSFTAGQIKSCPGQWRKLTEDKEVLQIVKGATIELKSSVEGSGGSILKESDFIISNLGDPIHGQKLSSLRKSV